jgi:uncharacterized protein (DUF2141 family)
MRRSTSYLLSSWTLAIVLTLTTLVGGVTASSRTVPAGVVAGAPAAVTSGTLCIVKFNDLDGDGKQGPNEPTLSGWVFTIKDANGRVVGTITTRDLAANCVDLPAGTYTVTETPQAGWTPTTNGGLTQTVTVVAGQTTTVTFGNHRTENGTLCIVKFNDLDGDGKQGPSEPTLSGWVFTIKDANGRVVGTITTSAAGTPNCIDLPAGTYTVTETLQAGWTPTTPGGGTQTVTVVAGQTTTVTFGNTDRCCLTFTFLGGKGDRFSIANGAKAEPVTPVSITAPPAYFDATTGDRPFAHRFYLGAGNCIQSATLEIRIKALFGGSTNDTMGIKVPGSSAWAKSISAISPTGTWAPPKLKTIVFNLGAMPSGGGSTNLIPALNSTRVLDVNIQDDTSVDYIKLVVVFCECVPN